jgi:hypothetical protein
MSVGWMAVYEETAGAFTGKILWRRVYKNGIPTHCKIEGTLFSKDKCLLTEWA